MIWNKTETGHHHKKHSRSVNFNQHCVGTKYWWSDSSSTLQSSTVQILHSLVLMSFLTTSRQHWSPMLLCWRSPRPPQTIHDPFKHYEHVSVEGEKISGITRPRWRLHAENSGKRIESKLEASKRDWKEISWLICLKFLGPQKRIAQKLKFSRTGK